MLDLRLLRAQHAHEHESQSVMPSPRRGQHNSQPVMLELSITGTDAAAAGADAAASAASAAASAVCISPCTYRGARSAPPIST